MVAFGVMLPVIAMPAEAPFGDSQANAPISIYPESGVVDNLNQITVATEFPMEFGAFVYMPSLYSINKDGSIGSEVSACELMDDSARGKDALQFKVINPPTRSGKYAFLIKDNSFSLLKHNEKDCDSTSTSTDTMETRARTHSNSYGTAFKNFPVNLESDTLRILHVSNSYGGNQLHYVSALLQAANVDVSKVLIERLMYSAASFKDWVDVYNDNNSKNYSYYKMAGGLQINMAGSEASKYDGSMFRMMLEQNRWDLIVINQCSLYAPYYKNWNSTGSAGYLPELLNVIRRYQPDVPVGMLLIHSYAKDYPSNTEHWTSSERWEKIRNGVEWLKTAYDIDFVIPYGTAIENLRLTKYNTTHELTGDGSHLASGLAQYTAGCCYFESIFSPRCKQTVWGNPLRVHDPEAQFSDKYEESMVPVDDASAAIAQKAAFLACRNMYELRNPYMADLTDYRYGDVLNHEEYCIVYELKNMETVDQNYEQPSSIPYCIYSPTGILIGKSMTEEDWMRLPEGLYIRNGEKVYKPNSKF